MTKVGLLIISTNKYTDFLIPLIESADKFFLRDFEVNYFVFTNKNIEIKSDRKIHFINVEHKPWPWMTLGRYKIFSDNSHFLSEMDYLFYCDVDMVFVNHVGDEIIGDRVATQHPGHYLTRGTPETNPNSLAFVPYFEKMQYFAGGFNGGRSNLFLEMSKHLDKNIEIDYSKGIIAIWHDESHLNKYLINNKPTIILDPGYCYNEFYCKGRFVKKLLALDKNHNEIRT